MFLNASKVEYIIKKDGNRQLGRISINIIDNLLFNVPRGELERIQIKLKFDGNVIVPKFVTLSINQNLMELLNFECILKDKEHKIYFKGIFSTLLTYVHLREDTSQITICTKNVFIPKETNMHMFSNCIKY